MDKGKHIPIQRLARLAMERPDAPDPSREALERHLEECGACRAAYEEVRRMGLGTAAPAHPPALYPQLDPAPCPRMEAVENYQRLPLHEKLSFWAHVVYWQCEDCAAQARLSGLSFDRRLDPVTQSLLERFGAKTPRRDAPAFLSAMAGAGDEAGRAETMNATVMMAVRPRKRCYRLTVYRRRPEEPGGFWRVRVRFEDDVRLPRGFSMFIYQDGYPEKPIRTSYTGELELELPEGIYHLNLNQQDYLLIPLILGEPRENNPQGSE